MPTPDDAPATPPPATTLATLRRGFGVFGVARREQPRLFTTDVQVQQALPRLTTGHTTIAIAHRLSTTRTADTVVVIDRCRIVEVGRHVELVDGDGVDSALFRTWLGTVTEPADHHLEAGTAPWR